MLKIIFISIFILFGLVSIGQEVWMQPNSGQWDSRIEYKVDLQQGEMLIEKDGFTYFLNNAKQKMHEHGGDHEDSEANAKYEAHVIKTKFKGSSWTGELKRQDSSAFYTNYFLGSDRSKWVNHLHSYSRVDFLNFYTGIDLLLDGRNDAFKYSLRIEPNVSPNKIKIEFEGEDRIYLDDKGNLHIVNRFGEIIEKKPEAWTLDSKGNEAEKVDVQFNLVENTVNFIFPSGYDNTKALLIDPQITFSTFTGSTVDNWGMSATPDINGNLFGGGVAFGSGYPISVNAYDASFNGGTVDVALTKFTANGANLIYSTYIGGNGSETPNSMICAPNGELFIFGLTSSTNFPMAGSPYDASYNGGPNASANANGLGFQGGTDLYVVRLSPDGSTLMASTYIGGSSTDGLNASTLNFNYGDQFRGEIILDNAGNVYVASTTQSSDFPTFQGPQGSLNGLQDAVVFKMPPTLNTLSWSGFFGGSGVETGNSIQVSSTGDVYFVGGTTSTSLPISSGEDLTFNGGAADGYVTRLNGINGGIISGSYMGLSEYDQAYCVQMDLDDNVYILGQTESNWPITAGHYGVANSGQFIRKYNSGLSSILWTTMVGAGTGHVEISPTAFLVSDCYDIYFSGWGGQLNIQHSQAVNSTSSGFPVTFDAYQSTTSGSNFYISVLDQDAMSLKYGTFMGGVAGSPNHVDGGTSRFDKSGRIYHAVCAACGGNSNGFTSTPGAWSTTNNSTNCNLAAFKFELSTIDAIVSTPNTIVCLPDPVIFNNNSANGNSFFWDFGDGTFSNDVNPSHLYPGSGYYNVTLVVSDTNGCFTPDSVEFVVHIGSFEGGVIQPTGPICPGESYQLEAFGGSNYLWSPAQFLDDSTSATPIATVFQTTDFTIIVSDSCGIDTVYVTLPVFIGNNAISNDTSICIGNSVDLFANGGVSYVWTPPTYLDDPLSGTPVSTPGQSIDYFVEITTADGCVINDSVTIDVYYTPPIPVIPDTLTLCLGSSLTITASGAETYSWSPNIDIDTLFGPIVEVNPQSDMFYYCDFTNACGTVPDSVFIDLVAATIVAGYDTIICPGESVNLWATGGVSYYWSPSNSLNNHINSLVTSTPYEPTMYYVTGVDQYGCVNGDSVWVDLFPFAFIQTCPDVYAFFGDQIQLSATSTTTGPYIWSPSEFLSCVVCEDPIANPDQNYFYIVSYTDQNGCTSSDSVHIYYDPIIYVPNTFTPNEDGMNQFFFAVGGNIKTFEMTIYNRWGELIFTSDKLEIGWDGTYEGNKCQDGTYVWKIALTDYQNEEHKYVGHVNLLR